MTYTNEYLAQLVVILLIAGIWGMFSRQETRVYLFFILAGVLGGLQGAAIALIVWFMLSGLRVFHDIIPF